MQSDEFYKNLTMFLDDKDQELYNEWSLWTSQSNDRYYIDGQLIDGEVMFFTNERTEQEIELMHKRNEEEQKLRDLNLDLNDEVDKAYFYLATRFINSHAVLRGKLIPYEVFKQRFSK